MVRCLPVSTVCNPLRHTIKWTWPMVLKLVLGAVLLVPIRLPLFILSLIMLWPLCTISCFGWEPGSKNHLKKWQQWMILNILCWVDRLLMFSMGFNWITYKGKRASPQDAPITVIAPHSTIGDGMILGCSTFGSPVSRLSNYTNPVFRPLLTVCEPIIVNRKDKGSRSATVDEVRARIASPGRWTSVVFFPEGTCGNGKALLGFKGGPFYPGCDVQPVTFNYFNKAWGIWTFVGPNFLQCFFLTMCELHNPLEIEFLPVYRPSEQEKQNPYLFASNVQSVMARSLGVPATNYTFEDAELMTKGINLGLPEDAALIEYGLMHDIVGMNLSEMSQQLDRFVSMDQNKDGFVTVGDMKLFFCWPVEHHVELFFKEYDTSSRGKVTFREFLLGLADLSHAVPNVELLCKKSFEVLSSDADYMTVSSLRKGFSTHGHEISEEKANALFDKIKAINESVNEVVFTRWTTANPEYHVLVQWLIYGMDSFPTNAATPDDEPDKRLAAQS